MKNQTDENLLAEQARIQVCRGISIIAVLAIHNNPERLATVIVRPFYCFAVAAFLMLSGYLTKVPVEDVKGFYKKRLKRVLVPYVIWTTLFTIASGKIMRLPIYILGFAKPSIFYYFAVYIQFVLLTPAIGKLLHSRHWRFGFLITPISLIPIYILAACKVAWPSLVPETYKGILCLVWFTFYYLGLCVRNGCIKIDDSYKKYMTFTALCTLMQIAEGVYWWNFGDFEMSTGQLKLTAILGSTGFLLVMLCYIQNGSGVRRRSVSGRFLKYIGDDSFGIYLSHIMIMTILNKTLYQFIPQIFPADVLILIAIEIAGMEICKRIFQKHPVFCRYVGLM